MNEQPIGDRDIIDAATICGYYLSADLDAEGEGHYCVPCAAWVQLTTDLPTCGGPGVAIVVYGSYDARSNCCRRCTRLLAGRQSLATWRTLSARR